jgi:organic radical activating enzyme
MKYRLEKRLRGPRRKGDIQIGEDHLHLYLTVRCQFSCYFCVNAMYGPQPTFRELSGRQWLDMINRLRGVNEIYLQGGEPMLHPDFLDIVNGLDGFNVCIYTNLPESRAHELPFIRRNNNNILVIASYHPLDDRRAVNEFVDTLRLIPNDIKVQPHIEDIPEVSPMLYARAFRRHNIYLESSDVALPTRHNTIKRIGTVQCNSHMEVVAPDMTVYPCLGLMWRQIDGIHLSEYNFQQGYRTCHHYGLCGLCSTAKEIKR